MPEVSPEWFFSTIAQASAASIGFLIAFISTLYATRKSRTNERTIRMVESLSDIESDFDPVLDAMEKHLQAKGDFPAEGSSISEMKRIGINQDELTSLADGFSQSKTVKFYANIVRTQEILDLIVLPQPNDQKSEHLKLLNETTKEMAETIGKAKNALVIFSELTNTGTESDDPAKEILFPHSPEIEDWLKQNFSNEPNNTIAGWKEVIEELNHKTTRAGAMAQNSDLVVDFTEYKIVLRRSLTLFFVGVVFPMIFLFSWTPDWWFSFSNDEIALIELITLGAVVWHTQNLFQTVTMLIDLGSVFD